MKRSLPYILAMGSLLLVGCSSPAPEVTGIVFSQTVYTVEVDESIQLEVILFGGEKKVTYISTNEEVLSVSPTGLATGLKIGEATVLAICNDHIARCGITVLSNGLSEVDVFGQKATVKIDSFLPAFGLNGKSYTEVTYVYEDDPAGRRYVETSTPRGDLLLSMGNLSSSPFVLNNPNFEIPTIYERFSSYAEQVQTGPFISKTLYQENVDETHFYDGNKYLGKETLLGGEGLDIDQALSELSDLLPLLEDPMALLLALLSQEQSESKTLQFLFALLASAKLESEKVDETTTYVLTFDEKAGEAILDYFDQYNFGEGAKLNNGTLTIVGTGEESWTLTHVDLSFSATLFGEDQTCALEVSINPEKTPYGRDFFRNVAESFKNK
ncbi:MAG: Ig-like domain-containing protein [Bacilli bacterium]|nr:Ig-like domain-containing protein [Bacilli bacterium]